MLNHARELARRVGGKVDLRCWRRNVRKLTLLNAIALCSLGAQTHSGLLHRHQLTARPTLVEQMLACSSGEGDGT
jgi:hypothetical protein